MAMECVPNSVEEALFTWSVFGVTASVSLVMSRYIVSREAGKAGSKGMSTVKNSLARFNALIISLILYMMVLGGITAVLFTILLYAAIDLFHLFIQGLFRVGDLWKGVYHVQRMLYAVDKYLRPGLFLGYFSARHWIMHASVLACSLLCGSIHTILFIHTTFKEKRRQEAAENEEKSIKNKDSETLFGVRVSSEKKKKKEKDKEKEKKKEEES